MRRRPLPRAATAGGWACIMEGMASELIAALKQVLGPDDVLSDPAELLVYECDGFTIARARPSAVVFPRSTEQVVAVVRLLQQHGVQIVPRGSGTGLGLAIVKKIIEDHGGRLELHDAPASFHGGVGAMVRMLLPAAPDERGSRAGVGETAGRTEKIDNGV